MKELIIAPSILSLDYSKVEQQLEELNQSNAKWMHFDVMDGHFVPNLTFGPDIMKGFKKAVNMIMDVHIMVDNPFEVAKYFCEAKCDILTFHYEAIKDNEEGIKIIKYLHDNNVQAGISIKPGTSVETLLPFMKDIDLVLIMSVEPGFGGQSFNVDMLEKVKFLRNYIDNNKLNVRLEIDGGINDVTAKLAVDAGCDTLVAGSYVFKGDIKERIDTLLCLKK